MLTFNHAVIYNGNFYPANTPIEVKEVVAKNETTTETDEKAVTTDDNKRTSRKSKAVNSSD